MRCEDAALLLSARLDGELSEAEEQELNDHLAGCPACRALAEDLASLRASLERLEDEPDAEGFAARVMESVRAAEGRKKIIPLFRRPQARAVAGLAACAVLCVGLYAASQARKRAELDANFQSTARAAVSDSVQEEGAIQGQMELAAAEPEALMESEDQAVPDGGMLYSAGESFQETAPAPSPSAAAPTEQSAVRGAGDALKQAGGLDGLSDGQEEAAVAPALSGVSGGEAETGAVLTLSAWPEGTDGILSPDTPVSYSPAESVERCRVTREEFQALAELAEEQGLLLAKSEGDGSAWTVEVLPS